MTTRSGGSGGALAPDGALESAASAGEANASQVSVEARGLTRAKISAQPRLGKGRKLREGKSLPFPL